VSGWVDVGCEGVVVVVNDEGCETAVVVVGIDDMPLSAVVVSSLSTITHLNLSSRKIIKNINGVCASVLNYCLFIHPSYPT